MRKIVATTLGILVATLTMAGIGQAQGFTTVQGTIQAVDCQTNALVLRAPDGTHVFPAGPSTAVFVNSAPVSLCALQRYIGSSATVSIAPYASQWVAERVDVYVAATTYPGPAAPTYSTVPPWLGIVVGTIIVGGLVYLLVRGHDGAIHRYPYSGRYDQPYGPNYGPYPYQYGPYQYGPYQRGPYQQGPYGYGPYPYGPYQQCSDRAYDRWCRGRDAGDSNR